jgi:hypothetical protein
MKIRPVERGDREEWTGFEDAGLARYFRKTL